MKFGIILSSRGDLARHDSIVPISKKANEHGHAVKMLPDHIVLPR